MAELITDALHWWIRARPDRVALDVGDEEVTYEQLGTWTDATARLFVEQHGVVPGDVVAIAGTNSLEWCIATLAAIKAGAIATPVNYRYTTAEVEFLVNDCRPKLVIVDTGEHSKVAAVVERGHALDVVPMAQIRALQHVTGPPVRVEVDPSDPAVLAYTSGTTGHPKGLVYTHRTILSGLFELLLQDPTPPEETSILLTVPLFSVAGIVHALIHMTSRGAKAVVMLDFNPRQALELLTRHRISHMNGVPVIFERIAQLPDFDQHDLSHLKVAMVGGARVSDELLLAFHRQGVALRHMYGMTEVGGCGSVPRVPDALAHPELCGDGMIFTEFKTVRPNDSDCEPGEQGEIVIRGPAMMARYWNNAEATSEATRGGWLHSGDIGVVDEQGYLRYVDRLKDIIISGGFNISPSEVENVISTVPGVTEVAVISVPDKRWGETPAAIIYSEAGRFDQAAVLEAARANLAVFKVPRYVVRTEAPLPRLASGKIAKRQLREEYVDLPTRVHVSSS